MLQKQREDNSKCAFGDDIIAKNLFNRPTHEAYDRRAKQDTVVNYIADKFAIGGTQVEKERLRDTLANSEGFNKQFAPEMQATAEVRRKHQTMQMKSMLDRQIQL